MIFLQILRLLAVMVLAFGAGKLASKLKMPAILGWLIAGMVLGPHALNLLDQQTLDAAWFGSVEHLLECVAGLMIGTELLWKKLRSAGRQSLVTTVTESLGTFAVLSLVFACVFRITGVPVYLAFLFGGIALATAPAPSLSIVNELKTNGPVTRTLMPMAALEAVGYSVNQQIKLMESHDNVVIDQIFAVGGGVKNPAWMQIVADITGKTISTPAVTVGASFGDAMMAALGVHYDGFEDFASLTKFIKPGKSYEPNMENHEKYKKFQSIYDRLYEATKDLAHELSE